MSCSDKQASHLWRNSELRLVKSITVITIVCVMCVLPYCIVVLYDREDQVDHTVYVILLQILHVNNCLNWLIYAAFQKDFKEGYYKLLSFFCKWSLS